MNENVENPLRIFYIRTFVPTCFWHYVNHSDLYIIEKSANLSSYITTIVKIIWSTVNLLSLKKCKFVPKSDHALVWQIRVGVDLISVMFQGWALINACQCRRWNEKCKINSNLWNTLTQTWNNLTTVRFPIFSILPKKTRKLQHFWPKIEIWGFF